MADATDKTAVLMCHYFFRDTTTAATMITTTRINTPNIQPPESIPEYHPSIDPFIIARPSIVSTVCHGDCHD
ncbi:MAG: hypothetical protein ABIO19_02920 [Burkholderiaceae bacterium]